MATLATKINYHVYPRKDMHTQDCLCHAGSTEKRNRKSMVLRLVPWTVWISLTLMLMLHNQPIDRVLVTSYKHLGVTTCDDLSWSKLITRKAMKLIDMLHIQLCKSATRYLIKDILSLNLCKCLPQRFVWRDGTLVTVIHSAKVSSLGLQVTENFIV